MKRIAYRKLLYVPTLLALSILFGCGDNDPQAAVNENTEEDARIAAEHGWKVSNTCNLENIIGTWEKFVPMESDSDGFTSRLVFEPGGTFIDTYIDGSFQEDRIGEYEIESGRMVTHHWDEDEEGNSYNEVNEGCYIIENGLYLNYDIFFNPDADAESLDGTWVLRAAVIDEYTYVDGSSEKSTEDDSLTFTVAGPTFDFTKLELWDDFENGSLIDHADTPEFKVGGTLRVNGNEIYATFTSDEIDIYDQITLNQEELFGLRMSRQLIYWTTDPSVDPYGSAYMKVD